MISLELICPLFFEPTSVGRIFGWGILGREGSALGKGGRMQIGRDTMNIGKVSVEVIWIWGKGSGSLFSVYTKTTKLPVKFCGFY